MCGIVAGVSYRNIVPILTEGLRRMEYRGYDSCGVAVVDDGELKRSRTVKRVQDLIRQTEEDEVKGPTGIAHTRWATHGAPEIRNTHPLFSNNQIAVVHNGIIENYASLKEELIGKGYEFVSQTDTEVIAHLVHFYYKGDLLEAVENVLRRIRGAFALAISCKDEPGRIVAARVAAPLVIALGENENFAASDPMALAGVTDHFIYLEDGDVADVQQQSAEIYSLQGDQFVRVDRPVSVVQGFSQNIALGPYTHYMQKEIFEQPQAISDTLEGVVGISSSMFGHETPAMFKRLKRVLILACGTSYYAGMVAKYWLEALAKVPCDVEIASEYRYRESVPDKDTLVLTISQSGETADTLAALEHAKSLGMDMTMTICNVATSAMVKRTRAHYITRAGVEIGVASTKAFTTQLASLFLMTSAIAKEKGLLSEEEEKARLQDMRHLPEAMRAILEKENEIKEWASVFAQKNNALFLGRGMHYPIALEGALKLKEISYINANAYAAGELKHGPIALLDENMPVMAVLGPGATLPKMISNCMEAKARNAPLAAVISEKEAAAPELFDYLIKVPQTNASLFPILANIPLQLLAYYIADALGREVDQPRNLAKSVTVE